MKNRHEPMEEVLPLIPEQPEIPELKAATPESKLDTALPLTAITPRGNVAEITKPHAHDGVKGVGSWGLE